MFFLNLCRKIAISSSYHEIEREAQAVRKVLTNFEPKWTEDLNSIKLYRERLGLKADEYKNQESVLYRKQRLWMSFCDHYSLPTEIKKSTFHSMYHNFHSFRYWVNYRITYENKLFEGWNPKRSDYLDWQQVVYLNIMDYIVTEDKGFRAILNECAHEEKSKVAMSYDEFMRQLSELPSKRAPDTTIEEWHNAS